MRGIDLNVLGTLVTYHGHPSSSASMSNSLYVLGGEGWRPGITICDAAGAISEKAVMSSLYPILQRSRPTCLMRRIPCPLDDHSHQDCFGLGPP